MARVAGQPVVPAKLSLPRIVWSDGVGDPGMRTNSTTRRPLAMVGAGATSSSESSPPGAPGGGGQPQNSEPASADESRTVMDRPRTT